VCNSIRLTLVSTFICIARDATTYIAGDHGSINSRTILIYSILHMCYETTHFEVSKIDCRSLLYSFQREAIQAVDSRGAEACLVKAMRSCLIEQSLSSVVYNAVMDRTAKHSSSRDVEDMEAMLQYALICIGSILVILRSELSSSSSSSEEEDGSHHDCVHYSLLHPLLLRSQEILMACESCLMRLSSSPYTKTIHIEEDVTDIVKGGIDATVVATIKMLQRSIVQFCNTCLYSTSDHRLHSSFAHELWLHRSNTADKNESGLLECYTIYNDHAFNDATRALHNYRTATGHAKERHISSILDSLHDLYTISLLNMR